VNGNGEGAADTIVGLERFILASTMCSNEIGAVLEDVDRTLGKGYPWRAPKHAVILDAIRARTGRGELADPSGVNVELVARGKLDEVGGTAYLVRCIESCANTATPERWTRELAVILKLEQSKALASIISADLKTGKDVTEKLARLAELSKPVDATPKPEPTFKELAGVEPARMCDLAHLLDQEVEYTIKPVCPRGTLTLLQGAPKSGKSVFALYAGISASMGNWTSGLFTINTPLKVMLVEYEDAPILVVKRASRYLAGMGLDRRILPTGLYLCDYPTLWVEVEKYKELLIREIADNGYDLVVIDTLSYVHHVEDENASADMKPVMAALKQIAKRTNCSIILIHHTGKGAGGKNIAEKARGSSAIAAAADVILDWGDREKSNITPVKFVSKYDDGYEFLVHYTPGEDGAVAWSLEQAEEADPDAVNDSIMDAIVELCRTSPDGVSLAAVARALPKISERTVYRKVGGLEKAGKVSIGRGVGPAKTVKPIE
jgi:KaiC/GvpD/RAD55 family RecA-like ATPase